MATKKMEKRKVADLSPFSQHVIQLKSVKRAGWISTSKIGNPESVADHSYSTCAISMALSDMLGLDTERVMKMSILHDLPESIIGDYLPGEVTKKQKRLEENNAIDAILNSIPSYLRSDYKGIWEEYILNKTDIARLVHAVDKVEMALQARKYAIEGCPPHRLVRFFDFHKKYTKDDNHEIFSQILNALKPSYK
ncbi:MAG: HD domain-containing protein [Candidatus Nitrosopolaris sp.]